MRSLVIGCSGQVGGALVERLGPEGHLGACRKPRRAGELVIDLERAAADRDHVCELFAADAVAAAFIAAGMTWVDGCEAEPSLAYRINCEGAATIAELAREHGARTVYFSTEYVFDGEDGPYSEDDAPHPISVYGKSKLAGEQAVLAADPSALVLRTTVVFGPEDQGKNFAYRLVETLAAGGRLAVPADQRSNPTYNRDLADAAVRLLGRGATGIFNVVGPEVMDRFEFAKRLAVAAGADATRIDPVATESLGQAAPRPLRAGLETQKLRAALGDASMRTVEAAVADWLQHPRGRSWATRATTRAE